MQSQSEAVATALDEFAHLIGISNNELMYYGAKESEHLLRKLLACQTSEQRASPQHVLSLIEPDEADRIDYETNGAAWSIIRDTIYPTEFYTSIASDAQFSLAAHKNPMFRQFAGALNDGLPKKKQMRDPEVFLMYHLLNASNARDVLLDHFDNNVKEANRVHNIMTQYMSTMQPSETAGNFIGDLINGVRFPMFKQGNVQVGMTMTSQSAAATQKADVDESTVVGELKSFPMELDKGTNDSVVSPWSVKAEMALRKNAALERFRKMADVPLTFSRKSLWKQAVLSSVVPESRRDMVPIASIVGRKQYESQVWKQGPEWLDQLSRDEWNNLWSDLGEWIDANAILTGNKRAQAQTQILYNALCTELGSAAVKEDYTALPLLKLAITAHLPESDSFRLLSDDQQASRAFGRAKTRYLDLCPHLGRALLNALKNA